LTKKGLHFTVQAFFALRIPFCAGQPASPPIVTHVFDMRDCHKNVVKQVARRPEFNRARGFALYTCRTTTRQTLCLQARAGVRNTQAAKLSW